MPIANKNRFQTCFSSRELQPGASQPFYCFTGNPDNPESTGDLAAMALKKPYFDERPAPASRARFRTGKLLDLQEKPVCNCTLYDLESGNTGIILQDEERAVPETVFIQDDKDLTYTLAQIRWRMGPYLFSENLERPVPLSQVQKG